VVRKRTLSNIVLLVIAASLAAFIAFTPEEEPQVVALEPLSGENPRAISRIHLELSAGGTIKLRRTDGSWDLVVPMDIAANDLRVNALLGVLEAPVHARIDASAQSLGRFGLAPAQARVLLDDQEVLFGDTEPIHGRRYLLFDGRVALLDDAYFSHLSSTAANYVHPALLGREPKLQSIVLPDLRIYRIAGEWHADAGARNATGDAITRLADAWRQAQATAVRSYEQSLDWSGVVVVELADEELRFDLAHTEFELILGRADLGIQYHLTKRAGARLLRIEPAFKAP
jgi:hypothetical protein